MSVVKMYIDNKETEERLGLVISLESGEAVIAVGDFDEVKGTLHFDHHAAAELGAVLLAFAETVMNGDEEDGE